MASRLPSFPLLARRSNPAILPISPTRSGNNKPKSLQKTKRTFKPNLTRVDWPVTLLGGLVPLEREASGSALPKLRGVKMQMRRIRDVEKAGGIEGLLLSRRSKDLTPFGAALRSRVFDHLHQIKADLKAERAMIREEGLGLESGSELSSDRIANEERPLVEGR
ncbi:hypothetical protein CI109_103474 [Kwoniella shandongensis]|uniref:Uncharacterized protein n=1 Tax=Kwoniella shandongensis TaxID=1734106 RepID=A0A5M6BW53_9TREE|nr:uncharacterized protein CI109_004623 [Kwoniella shandongensis]KAA5527087.1 hypothetical protein CI109_004623 [Kwoniella shandongensis]